ncbi:tetratricopeptide repeat protein [Actinoplanes sp. NPDC051494]|uniref:fibronectin type III domain-containing protein n=1 Tax=Actinoplanes sp. NPDC051494 TaxID=3363907 RepID=UPI0037ADE557
MSQPFPLHATRQRAQALVDSGDPAQARALLEHAVELGKVNLGEDDPEVLGTAHQLAVIMHGGGDAPAARRVLEEAYAAGQWRLGESDPLMLGISYELGVVAEEMENRHEARRAFGRVAANGPAVLGPDHWQVTRARAYLGEDPATVRIELPDPPAERPVVHFPPTPASPPTPAFSTPPAPAPPFSAPPPVAPPAFASPVPVQRQPSFSESPFAAPGPVAPTKSGFGVRAPALFAAIAAVLGVVIAVVALVTVLAKPGDKDDASDVPTLDGPAPTNLQLSDYGSSIKLSWADPASGRVNFIVTGAHSGEQLKPMGTVGPSTTTFNLKGLNADLDYCFVIVAVYSTTKFSPSEQACTTRASGEPSSVPTR